VHYFNSALKTHALLSILHCDLCNIAAAAATTAAITITTTTTTTTTISMSISIKYLHSAKSRRSNLMHGVWVTRCDRQKRKIKINAGLKSDKTVR